MKPGTMVAFILNAQIQFGILAALVTRETKDGETKQFVVTSIGADGTANSDVTIESEDDVIDLDAWNKGDKLLVLAARMPSYQWAQKKSEEDEQPARPPSDDPIVIDPSPAPKVTAAGDNF